MIQNIPACVVMKVHLTTGTWINSPTCILTNLVFVVRMDILSIISSFQIFYTMMSLLSRIFPMVLVVVPSTGD